MFDKNSTIWYNKGLCKASDLNISIFTHALHYGTAVFEGIRVYNSKIFKAKEHYERLIKSGELIDVPVGYDIEELVNGTLQVLKANNFTDAYIRPIAWRNDNALGVKSYANDVNVAICAWVWKDYYGADKVSTGINLAATRFVRPDPRSTETQAKAAGLYFIGSIMQNKCHKDGHDDVLMLDWRGFIAECTSCNVFFIKGDEIHTPIPDCFLNGITRQTIIELVKEMGYKVYERHITPQELGLFDEAFVTGTAIEIMPVNSIFDSFIMKSKKKSLEIRKEYLSIVS